MERRPAGYYHHKTEKRHWGSRKKSTHHLPPQKARNPWTRSLDTLPVPKPRLSMLLTAEDLVLGLGIPCLSRDGENTVRPQRAVPRRSARVTCLRIGAQSLRPPDVSAAVKTAQNKRPFSSQSSERRLKNICLGTKNIFFSGLSRG